MSAKNNLPLFYALTQVKFSPIAKIAEFVPAIQETLRNDNYPGFKEEIFKQLSFQHDDLNTLPIARWNFINSANTECFTLLSDSLIFRTTQFHDFEDFLQKMLQTLRSVHKLVKIGYIERIGLRYLNVENHPNSSMNKFLSTIDGTFIQSFSETLTQINNSTLVIRSIIAKDKISIPADLLPLTLNVQSQFSTVTGRSATLDMDCFTIKQFNFDIKQIKNELTLANQIITQATHKIWK